jgi:hypothetical protein
MTSVMGKKVFYVNIRNREEAEAEMAVFSDRGEWYIANRLEIFEAQAKVRTH